MHRFHKAWREERARVPAHAYVPMSFAPVEAYQFDSSHETITLQGLPLTVKAAHMKLSHSRMPFVRVYCRETQELVFDEYRISVTKQILSRELRALGYRKLSARLRHHRHGNNPPINPSPSSHAPPLSSKKPSTSSTFASPVPSSHAPQSARCKQDQCFTSRERKTLRLTQPIAALDPLRKALFDAYLATRLPK
jgi:hypothetical protein